MKNQPRDPIAVFKTLAEGKKDIRPGYGEAAGSTLPAFASAIARSKKRRSSVPTPAIKPLRIVYVELTPMQRRFLKVLVDEVETILTDLVVQVLPVVEEVITDYRGTSIDFPTRLIGNRNSASAKMDGEYASSGSSWEVEFRGWGWSSRKGTR